MICLWANGSGPAAAGPHIHPPHIHDPAEPACSPVQARASAPCWAWPRPRNRVFSASQLQPTVAWSSRIPLQAALHSARCTLHLAKFNCQNQLATSLANPRPHIVCEAGAGVTSNTGSSPVAPVSIRPFISRFTPIHCPRPEPNSKIQKRGPRLQTKKGVAHSMRTGIIKARG